MPSSLNGTILFDLYHGEMLDLENQEYSEFKNLLKKQDMNVLKNDNQPLTRKLLKDIDLLILGNPINKYFSGEEIKEIEDFVRIGGNLLLISEYGSDYLQKTNLNELAKRFGFYFLPNIVKELNSSNENCQSIISIKILHDNENELLSHVRFLQIGGCCSLLLLNRFAQSFLKIKQREGIWTETYDALTKSWIINDKKEKEKKKEIILAACSHHGKGKIIGIGDVDIFSNTPRIGISANDHERLLLNLLKWFKEPVAESKLRIWILNQIGMLQHSVKEINLKLNNIIETLTLLEKRISLVEANSTSLPVKTFHEEIVERNDS